MYQIPFPTPDEMTKLKSLATSFAFSADNFIRHEIDFLDERIIEISTWVRILAQRLHESNFSFIMSSYYLNRGINDSEWYAQDGHKTIFFPNFKDVDYINKEGFEYYSEVFFYKSSSALDTIAHILSKNYDMKWKYDKIYFERVVERLASHDKERYNKFSAVINSDNFEQTKTLRNDATHNTPPGQVDSGIRRIKNSGLVISGIGKYTPVSIRYESMKWFKDTVFQFVDITKQGT